MSQFEEFMKKAYEQHLETLTIYMDERQKEIYSIAFFNAVSLANHCVQILEEQIEELSLNDIN
jgi:citrate lyase synthetase